MEDTLPLSITEEVKFFEFTTSNDQEFIALKRALEWELSLDSRNLNSHAWYHGPLQRKCSESLCQNEGDFLVRDCASQLDNYVLTCKNHNVILHFVINKTFIHPDTVYERVQYQFEEEAFDTVPDLITFYVGSVKPISEASGARIQNPVNRNYPLSFYGHKIIENQLHTKLLPDYLSTKSENEIEIEADLAQHLGNKLEKYLPHRCIVPSSDKKERSLTLLTHKHRFDNINYADARCQTIAHCSEKKKPLEHKFQTNSLPRTTNSIMSSTNNEFRSLTLVQKFDCLQMAPEKQISNKFIRKPPLPPPKPIRRIITHNTFLIFLEQQQRTVEETVADISILTAHQRRGSEIENISGESIRGKIVEDKHDNLINWGVMIKNPRFVTNSVSCNLLTFSDFNDKTAEDLLFTLNIPNIIMNSKFDMENFSTLLLPSIDNKPLDGNALSTFKMMVMEISPKIIAEHITQIDIDLLITKPSEKNENILSAGNAIDVKSRDNSYCSDLNKWNFNYCGLEVVVLPQGRALRHDLIERTHSIKLMVAVSILTCQTDIDQAKLISRWIQIALEIKTALGNLFSFTAVMLGLCMPQIQGLERTWHILRQKYTESAFTFEAMLRPTLISMNECSSPQAPNTTVPHVLSYILFKDRLAMNLNNTDLNHVDESSLYSKCITSCENKTNDFGMGILFVHLDSVRCLLGNLNLYEKNSKVVLEDSSSRIDELLSDAFRTEFHVKFLCGSKGSSVSAKERYSKLDKVLTLMAEKFCAVD